ncbi:MAG: hypothetical protein OES26_22085 [Gammaproteobacteria bacterium]|nr:hypothetical protein [Gammaproteobacteria bacterium]
MSAASANAILLPFGVLRRPLDGVVSGVYQEMYEERDNGDEKGRNVEF